MDGKEVQILGCQIKLSANNQSEFIKHQQVIDEINKEVQALRLQQKTLRTDHELSVLMCLKLMSEKLNLKHEFSNEIDSLKLDIAEAIKSVESINLTARQ
jgi:hypothetical protein